MIDLRKTYCKLDSEHIEQYKRLIREQWLVSIDTKKGIDGMDIQELIVCVDEDRMLHSDRVCWCNENHYTEFKGIEEESDNKMKLENGKKYKLKLKNGTTEMAVFNNEQVDHFDFCNMPGSIMLDDVEVTMNDNKHPHHDLIIEWAKDVSKKIEASLVSVKPHSVDIEKVINDTDGEYQFRFKPEREFIKGHWYPCVDKEGYENIQIFNGETFNPCTSYKSLSRSQDDFKWIGDSLGPISFGYFE